MLPPTSAFNPPAASISPINVVVVVFPFDPVMADNRPRQKRRRQFNLADDRLPQRPRLDDGRGIHGHCPG